MIKPEKLNDAFYALHLVLVEARFMAYKNEPSEKIAIMLDYAEALPRLMVSQDDMTENFRQYLTAIIDRCPSCAHILDKFDRSATPPNW